jgi:hypothetical protein
LGECFGRESSCLYIFFLLCRAIVNEASFCIAGLGVV